MTIITWWYSREWELILGIGLFSIGFGYYGFLSLGLSHQESLYRSIILFTCNTGPQDGTTPVSLEIGRWGSFLAVSYATVRTIFFLIATRVHLWGLRDHIVVCGFGEKGKNLALGFLASTRRVVAIEVDLRKTETMDRTSGFVLVPGDAQKIENMRKCRSLQARCLFAVTGSDEKNLQIALNIHSLFKREGEQAGRSLRCFVHVQEPLVKAMSAPHCLFSASHQGISFRIFNIYENSARIAFERFSPDRFRENPAPHKAAFHILIIGCGSVGWSLLFQAARMGHFASPERLRVSIIDQEIQEIKRKLYLKYPEIGSVLDLQFISSDVDLLTDSDFQRLHQDHPIQTIFLCLERTSEKLETALRLRKSFFSPFPQIVLMLTTKTSALTTIVSQRNVLAGNSAEAPVHVFNLIREGCEADQIIDESIDHLAKTLHEGYVAKKMALGKGKPGDPTCEPWDRLAEEFRDSNRLGADHLPIKLRAVGRVEGKDDVPFSESEIKLLARMEHHRWRAERLLAGWREGEVRDNVRRINPLLKLWEDLSPEDRRANEEYVAKTLPILIALKRRFDLEFSSSSDGSGSSENLRKG